MEMKGIINLTTLVWFSLVTLLSLLSGNEAASPNKEVKVLSEVKKNLEDPYGVLHSWDTTLANPCTWLHVTCNSHNRVVRIDLGNASLSGKLVPQLGQLKQLQYLELGSNNIWGRIPGEVGKLKKLLSLDLYSNNLTGPIPPTLANLQNLRFLRLNNNSLTGEIPLSLTTITTLQVLDLSYNNLYGFIPTNGSFALFTYLSFTGNPHLMYPPWASPPMAAAPAPAPSSGNEAR